MRKAIKRMTVLLTGLLIILISAAAVMSGQVFTENYPVANAAPELIVINETNVDSLDPYFNKGTGTMEDPYLIETPGQFVKAMKEGSSNYKLAKDVLMTSSTNFDWKPVSNFSGSFNGGGFTVTYSASTNSGGSNFGLFSFNSGIISNLKYVFTGSFYKEGPSNYGALVGYNNSSGIIDSCHIELSGGITIFASGDNQEVIAGGVIGYNKGKINKSTIISNINIDTNTYKEEKSDRINSTAYAGGIIGVNYGYIEECKIEVQGSISTSNQHKKAFLGARSSALFTSGGVIGYSNGGTISASDIISRANVVSMGNDATYGVAGGVVGVTDGAFNIIKTRLDLGSSVQASSAYDQAGDLYTGGIVARLRSDSGQFKDNIVKINMTKDNLMSAVYQGILLGQGSFGTWNKGNIWFVYDIRSDVGNLVGNGATGSTYNVMDVRGSGTVDGVINKTTGAITLKATPQYSPLYGWMANAASQSRIQGTFPSGENGFTAENGTGEFYPQMTSTGARFEALFLKTHFNQAGDFNVLADLTAAGGNWPWIEITLDNDITAIGQYSPIGNKEYPFRGKFNGQNKNITFTSTSLIKGVDEAALFGYVGDSAIIENMNIAFGGEVKARNVNPKEGLTGSETPRDTNVHVAMLAAVNKGLIRNITLLTTSASQIRSYQTNSSYSSIAGGLVGRNLSGGTIKNAHVTIQGKVHAVIEVANSQPIAGGLVGVTEVRPGGIFTTMGSLQEVSVAIEGEVSAFDKARTGTTMYSGGLVGYNVNSSDFAVLNGAVSIRKTGIFGNPGLGGQGNGNNVVGAISSNMNTGSTTFILENFWAILDKTEDSDIGMKMFGNDNSPLDTKGENRLFISGGIVQADLEPSTGQISMNVPIGAGEIFAGWFLYDDYTGMLRTELEGVYGNVFKPDINLSSQKRYTKVITSIIYNYAQFADIAHFTNQGNDFTGVEFVLGANIDIGISHQPIGRSPETKFNGIFNGGSLNLTVSDISVTNRIAGIFGYLGSQAHVYGFNIVVSGNISETFTGSDYSAVLAAYNEGTIGLNSPSQKTTITLASGSYVKGINAAGIVACNASAGLIYNIDLIIDGGVIEAGRFDTSAKTYAGGAVAVNYGIVKNIKIQYLENSLIIANSTTEKTAGGAVGLNNGILHSIVVVARSIVDSGGAGGTAYVGGVVGNNITSENSNLWMVIDDPNSEVDNLPEGTSIYGVLSGANLLKIYGPGAIEVTVEANTAGQDDMTLGGMIVFKSVISEESGNRTFYGYMKDLDTGEMVANTEGVIDYIFTPYPSMKSMEVYSVFALSKINTLSDLIQVSEDVNEGINPKIIYNLQSNITISSAFNPIGTDSYPFNGIFKGNQKTVTFGAGAEDVRGLFGTVAENGEIEFLNVTVARTALTSSALNSGGICAINNGEISNVKVELNQTIKASNAAGGIAGINNGSITAAVVNLKYTVIGGVYYDGSVEGANYAGGIAGLNNGNIGCSTVQDIKVIFDNGAKVRSTANNSASGGIAGVNAEDALIMSAFMTINGIIKASGTGTAAGGIAGRNAGLIHTIYILIEGQGDISGATAIGVVVGNNSGIIGLESGAYNNINVGIYKSYNKNNTLSGQKIGGVAGVMSSGDIVNAFVTIGANIHGSNCAGGLAGEAVSGNITNIKLSLGSDYSINGVAAAGGLIGINSASISNVELTIDGRIKCELSENVIASESKAGGAVGINSGTLTNVLATLKKDVIATYKGSIAGISGQQLGSNVWVLLSNSINTNVSSSDNTGYNCLKIVGDASFKSQFNESHVISFSVMTSTTPFYNWYSDISNGTVLTAGISYGINNNTFTPDKSLTNKNYHISFYSLDIYNISQFKELANYINHHSFFNNVKFTLIYDIIVPENVSIVPVGTKEYPFNAIFDGNGKTVKFLAGSSIGAVAYSGLFGYTSSNSILKNFILDINEGVIIGGQSPLYTGALIGYSNGQIENVLVKLASTPRASSVEKVGGIAGYINPDKTAFNTWLIIHNASCKASSNSYYNEITSQNVHYGINVMNILGTGDFLVDIGGVSHAFTMTVEQRFNTTFRGWFADISSQLLLNNVPGVGTVNSDTSTGNPIYYLPVNNLINRSFSISFIKLVIKDDRDLKNFSENINTYKGFNGVQFILDADIVVTDENFIPIGTKSNPFSGIFEGNGHSISFAGVNVYGSYPGLFGYIDSTGRINNLIVISNTTETPNIFGDDNAVYTGLVASYCDGQLKNVIAQVKNETTIYCVNKAGGMVGAIGPNFNAVNAWVILKEKSAVKASGIPENQINIMYSAGKGSIRLQIINEQITFTATPDGSTDPFYGYIDGYSFLMKEYVFAPQYDLSGVRYTAIFLNSYIRSYEELVRLSETINSGLNYSGVIYNLLTDITVQDGYKPIGGLVGNQIVKFKGLFNGNGYTITIPEDVTVTGAYTGLFGYIDELGGVKNLRMAVYGNVGDSRSVYTGSLAGYNEGSVENVAFLIGKTSTHTGSTGESGYIGYTTTIADNAWLINYNSRSVVLRNNQARYNGLNSFTILGAGVMDINFVNAENDNYQIMISALDDTYLNEWYYYLNGIKTILQSPSSITYTADKELKNQIYFVSFLKTDLQVYGDVLKLAEDVNEGYDFYGITFNLVNDITIESGFPGIGGVKGSFSGIFKGNNYRIIMPSDVTIQGVYSGIFGNINEYGTVKNIIVELNGTLGDDNTKYAGTFAYNAGILDNCIVIGYNAKLKLNPEDAAARAGTVIGYDVNSMIFNTWGLIASYNNIKATGIKGRGVNKMKVVGAGRITCEIRPDNSIKFTNDTDYNTETDISGWYRNYAQGAVISNYLGIGTVDSDNQTYYPAISVSNAEYEVVIIKPTISSESDLNVLANDINIGGYDFKNVTFTVNANFTVSDGNILIGMARSPFRGIIDGNNMQITIIGNKGLFGYNAGTIKNMNVLVAGNIFNENEAAAIAYINDGTIISSNVTIINGASIKGATAGAIAGVNNGTISGLSKVTVESSGVVEGVICGSGVGISNGTTMDIESSIYGHITGRAEDSSVVYVGGAVGYVREGVTRRIVSNIYKGAIISAEGETAYAGGLVGRNRSVLCDSVLFGQYQTVTATGAESAAGEFAGISNSNMANSWMVMYSHTGETKGVGNGPQSINLLTIYGNGGINLLIDRNHGGLLFYKDDAYLNSTIDGWYTAQDISVSENPMLGNISSSGEDYAPSSDIMGRRISVVFINTMIFTIEDLIDLADAVNGGMSSRYIEFVLQNDIDILDALPESIGTVENGFNFIFNGNGNKLNIYYDSPLSLFGHIGSAGVIHDLNINIYGKIGSKSTVYAGGLAAENEGVIESCEVKVIGKVIANTSGGVAGRNHANGTITQSVATISGNIESTGAVETNRAGGIAGRNGGIIDDCILNISMDGKIAAYGDITTYAGGAAGQNTGIITRSTIGGQGLIEALGTGPFNSFAGGIAASNTGTISNTVGIMSQMKVSVSGIKFNYAGFIAGSNKNIIKNVIITADDNTGLTGDITDTGVAIDDSGKNSLITNSWIYAEGPNAKSNAPAMNTIFVQDTTLLYNQDNLKNGILAFEAVEIDNHFVVFDNLTEPGVQQVYLENIHRNKFTPKSTAQGYVAGARYSNTISSGSEMKAFSKYINTDTGLLANATITLVNDIEIHGEYEPVGTINNRFTGTFNGASNRITVSEDVIFNGIESGTTYAAVFGYIMGSINDLIINIRGEVIADKTAGLAISNTNNVRNCVVYLIDGSLKGSTQSTTMISSTGITENIWTVTSDTSLNANYGKIIYVKGNGKLECEIFNNIVTFTALEDENNYFCGWTTSGSFVETGRIMSDIELTASQYDVEFVSLHIRDKADLDNIARLIPIGFVTDGITFVQVNDFLVSGSYNSIGTALMPFNGIYDGAGHKITMDALTIDSDLAGLFGNIGASGAVNNLILDIKSVSAPLMTTRGGLAAVSSGSISNTTVFGTDNYNIVIGTDNNTNAANLWLVTRNEATLAGIAGAGQIVIIGEGDIIAEVSGDTIEMTADTQGTFGIFAGWYKNAALISKDIKKAFSDTDSATDYSLIFISSIITDESGFKEFAKAVTTGFDMSGYTIQLNADITLNSDVTAGSLEHPFKGIFDGKGYTITALSSYQINPACLFAVNDGTITNVIIDFAGGLGYQDSTYSSAIGINNGTISDVCVICYDLIGNCAYGIATYTENGDILNSWFIGKNSEGASGVPGKGNKLRIVDDSSDIEASLNEGKFTFLATSKDTGKFVVWYDNFQVNTEYSELDSFMPSAQMNGARYTVNAINRIECLGELLIFADYVNSGKSFETETIYLERGFTITDCDYVPIGKNAANSFKGSFDGQGKSITIAEDIVINGEYAGLFGVNDGVILDLVVSLEGEIAEGITDQGIVCGINNQIIANSVVFVKGSVFECNALSGSSSIGTLNNCWYILAPSVSEGWVYGDPANSITIRGEGWILTDYSSGLKLFANPTQAEVRFAGYSKGGGLIASPELDTSLSSGAYYAEFVSLNIYEEEDLINLARMINDYAWNTAELTFEIINDIVTSENFVSIGNAATSFEGTINGNFKTICLNTVNEGTFDGFLSYSNDSLIKALAFIRDTDFAAYGGGVIVNNGTAVTEDTVLLTPIAGMAAGANAEVIIIGETDDLTTGDAEVAYDETSGGFMVRGLPNTAEDYALRGFYQSGERMDNDTDLYAVPKAGGNIITIIFRLRYNITFELSGILSGEAPINTPELEGAGQYWLGEGDVTLAIKDKNIGNGYLYRGIRLIGTEVYLNTDTFTYTFAVPSEHQSYEAVFELISFAYLSVEYNADRQNQEIDNENIDGLFITYHYEGIDNTEYPESDEAPIDVGSYKVTANIRNLDMELVGIRTVGYQITPAPLTMIVLDIKDKDYDTTADAQLNGVIMFVGIKTSAIREDLIDDISLEDVTFAFSNKNAGTWNIIVTNNTLKASSDAVNPDTYRNYWFGTELNQVVHKGVTPVAVTATIHPLEVSIMATTDVFKTYGELDPEFTYIFLEGSKTPYPGDDFTGSLSREQGEKVGVYKINRGTLSLSANYSLSVYTTGAELTIIRRIITIDIKAASKQYGAVDPVFEYQDISSGDKTGIINGDRLVLQWDYPRNALPSETPYSVEALFNPVKNPNYDIVSNLSRSVDGVTCKFIRKNAFTVNKRDIFVNVTGNNSKVYGSDDQIIKLSYTNNLPGDNPYATREAGENTGRYLISFTVLNSGGDVTSRYNIIPLSGQAYYFTITPKPIYINPAQVVKIYGEDGEEEIPWTANIPEGVEISGNLTRAGGNSVGEYPVELGTLTVSDNNYQLLVSDNTPFVIASRVLTVSISQNATKIYGDLDPTSVDFTVTGFAPDDTNIVVQMTGLTRIISGEATGNYDISGLFTLTGESSNNYSIEIVQGVMTIQPRTITLATADITMIYGANAPAVDVTLQEGTFVEGDTISGLGLKFLNFKEMNAGTYQLVPDDYDNKNYNINCTPGTLTIKKRTIKIEVLAISKVQGEEDPKFEYNVSGKLVNGDKFKGSFTREEGEKHGTYQISQGSFTISKIKNYDLVINYDNAVLTIERAPVSFVPIAVGCGGGLIFIGMAVAAFMVLRKLKAARIPI